MTEASALNTFIFGPKPHPAMLLREAAHRSANDMQLVLSMLAQQRKRAKTRETEDALSDAIDRVAEISRSRATMQKSNNDLGSSLATLCSALTAMAELRDISVSCKIGDQLGYHRQHETMVMTLIVNQLVVNAIKHAFDGQTGGNVTIKAWRDDCSDTHITVEVKGTRSALDNAAIGTNLGSDLVRLLAKSIGGTIDFPPGGDRLSKITLPTPPITPPSWLDPREILKYE